MPFLRRATVCLIGLLALTSIGCDQKQTEVTTTQSSAMAKQDADGPRTFVFENDWKVGDCTMLKGATMRAFANGTWNMDADVKSSDTNDTWRCQFMFLNENQAQVFRSPQRIRHMPERNRAYHWRVDGGPSQPVQQQFDHLIYAQMECSC